MTPLLRPVLAVATAGTALRLLWLLCGPGVAEVSNRAAGTASHDWELDQAVADLASCVAMLAAILVATAALATVAAELARRGGALPARAGGASSRWRRLVLGACGLTVSVAAATTPAALATQAPAPPAACAQPCVPSLDGLPLPELPTSARRHPASSATPAGVVVVRSGDSLWSIATSLAPPEASDGEIADLVSTLIAMNRDAIGANPDLIYPGTRLTTPGGTR